MKFLEKYYLYLTVFITGAVILVLEILGTRIVAPYYGTTIYVWSSLIGVTLMALSLGYYVGGKMSDKKPEAGFLYLIIFLSALSIVAIPLIMNSVLVGTNFLGPRFGALTSAALLFSVPLFLLGMVSPYAIKLKAKDMEKVGVTAGNLYGVATVGSFVGAILAGFYLIPNLGINTITYILGGLLVLIVAPHGINSRKKLFSFGVALIGVMVLLAPLISSVEVGNRFEIVYETEGAYSRLKVVDRDEVRYLLVDGAVENVYDLKSGEFGFDYLELLKDAVDYQGSVENVLMIGMGAGGIDKMLRGSGVEVVNLEVDPEIVDIAREYFDFTGKVVVGDGRNYVRNNDAEYDVVMIDVYGGYSLYPYLFSLEAFGELKSIMPEDGVLAINVISYETGGNKSDHRQVASIGRTLEEVFENVYTKATGTGFANIVFYASDFELEINDEFVEVEVLTEKGIVLTDDYNPIESFSLDMMEESHDYIREGLGNGLL